MNVLRTLLTAWQLLCAPQASAYPIRGAAANNKDDEPSRELSKQVAGSLELPGNLQWSSDTGAQDTASQVGGSLELPDNAIPPRPASSQPGEARQWTPGNLSLPENLWMSDSQPQTPNTNLSYCPGIFATNRTSDDGMLLLSDGLSCKRIATTEQPVVYADGTNSTPLLFHNQPDGAAVFSKDDGGWYYVSNSEMEAYGEAWDCGGVGAIEFDSQGQVIGYKRIANYLKRNCGGGKTPWNSWITCEEIIADDYVGKVYQVDPAGEIPHRLTAMGRLGRYESFTYDATTDVPTFYVTRDMAKSVVTRFTPNAKGMECYNQKDDAARWCTLENGSVDYLVTIGGNETGKFVWTTDLDKAERNAKAFYPNVEGIDSVDGKLFFVSKSTKRLVILDLKTMVYTFSSTTSGAFADEPDQVARLVNGDESILYFCEDGGPTSGVFGRDARSGYYTILEGRTDGRNDESTGLAWSPDALHMYVTYQYEGYVYDCTRDDKIPFHGATLDIKYHAV